MGTYHRTILHLYIERLFYKYLREQKITDDERGIKDCFEGLAPHQGFERGVLSFGELRFFGNHLPPQPRER